MGGSEDRDQVQTDHWWTALHRQYGSYGRVPVLRHPHGLWKGTLRARHSAIDIRMFFAVVSYSSVIE